MAVDVSSRIDIDRPREEVAAFAANPNNVANWYVNIKSVEWETEPPVEIGSRTAFVAQFMGRRLTYTYEVVTYAPGEKLVIRTAEGPFPTETSYLWENLDPKRTRMTLRNRGEPSGFHRLAAPFMAFAMRRANGKDLALLKRILEEADA